MKVCMGKFIGGITGSLAGKFPIGCRKKGFYKIDPHGMKIVGRLYESPMFLVVSLGLVSPQKLDKKLSGPNKELSTRELTRHSAKHES